MSYLQYERKNKYLQAFKLKKRKKSEATDKKLECKKKNSCEVAWDITYQGTYQITNPYIEENNTGHGRDTRQD